jgi:hypothetical protein
MRQIVSQESTYVDHQTPQSLSSVPDKERAPHRESCLWSFAQGGGPSLTANRSLVGTADCAE